MSGDSIITSRPRGNWVYTIFVIPLDGKLEGWVVLLVRDVTVKKLIKYFCIIKEKIVYMEWVIQSSMFYSFYLFLSILLSNEDSALVSDSNAYIWNSYCIRMFEFIFECWRNVLLVHALENLGLQMKKKIIWKRKKISSLLFLSFLNLKFCFLMRRVGELFLLSVT